MLSLNPIAAGAAHEQLNPEQVPSLEERTQAVAACCGVPAPVAALVSKYAMEKDRFYQEMFGFQQWIDCWGATPVALPPVDKLRERVLQVVRSEGRQLNTDIEKMSAGECANFLGCQGEEENPEPSDELIECLNRRVRPEDRLVAGFTCVVTYMPQFVRKDGRILAVTARTLALDLGPHPRRERPVAELAVPASVFDVMLTSEDANCTEPSCYFMMEQDIAPHTKGKKPSVLIGEITGQGDKGWQLPQVRNFIGAVFSRRAWKGQFLYGTEPSWTSTFGQGKSRSGHFLVFGGFDEGGLAISCNADSGYEVDGASGSRKFPARFNQLG